MSKVISHGTVEVIKRAQSRLLPGTRDKVIETALGSKLFKLELYQVQVLAQGLALELKEQTARIVFVRELALKIKAANEAGKRDESLERVLASMVLQIEVQP